MLVRRKFFELGNFFSWRWPSLCSSRKIRQKCLEIRRVSRKIDENVEITQGKLIVRLIFIDGRSYKYQMYIGNFVYQDVFCLFWRFWRFWRFLFYVFSVLKHFCIFLAFLGVFHYRAGIYISSRHCVQIWKKAWLWKVHKVTRR